jgi:hypothetical protein
VCNPGTCTITLDNSDGAFDPDNTTGPYYGYIRPNRRVRITVTISGTTYYLWSGYADKWTRTWPGGGAHSVTVLEATDRFKLLAKRTNTGTTVQEQADDRLVAILENGGVDVIVPAISRAINADGYACRTLAAHTYTGGDTLTNCQDVARADGGALFVDGQGKVVFQSTRFRTDNALSTTSQGTFGNATGAIAVEDSLDPTVDDTLMANRVLVTDYDGTVHTAEDTTAQGVDGLCVADLGGTLLRALDAPDRASDVLLLRKDPRPRYDAFTIDALTDDSALLQAVSREISDRVTLAITPTGGGTAWTRDQYVEGVEHDVDIAASRWLTTFPVSGAYGGARALPAYLYDTPTALYGSAEYA